MVSNSPSVEVFKEEVLRQFLWMEGDLEYKLDPLQTLISDTVRANFHNSKKICVLSSRQIGKSFWVMCFALEYLIRNPKTICRVIAPTKDKCEEIVEDNLNVILGDVPGGLIARSTTKNRWNLFNRSSLRIGALERQFVDKNRGGNASLIIYEECGFVSGDDFLYGVNSVIGPQLLRSKGHEIFVTSPSEQPDHPIHTDIAPACETLGTLFQYMVFESPTITDSAIVEAAGRAGTIIDLDFVAKIRNEIKNKDKVFAVDVGEIAKQENVILSDGFRREFLAEVIRPTSLMVIPTFHERETVYDFKIPMVAKWQVVIDWGGVRDKTVAFLMSYEFHKDQDLFVEEKVWDANTSTDIIVAGLKEWDEKLQEGPRWADVPGQLQIDLQETYDYTVHLPQKTNWLASVNSMAARFATKNVLIKPQCKFLIASVRAGMFNKTRTDFERTEALGHMDALAAAMYGIRCQNRESPYTAGVHSPTINQFVSPDVVKDLGKTELDKLSGKTFGAGPKRFGSFAK